MFTGSKKSFPATHCFLIVKMEPVSLKPQKPLFLACQILGVLPCDRYLQPSRFGVFYSIALNLMACVWLCYAKLSTEFWDSTRASGNFIVQLMVAIREVSDFVIVGAHASALLFRRKTLEKVITGIKFLDLANTIDDRPSKIFFVLFITCNTIIISVANCLCPPLYFHSQSNMIEVELSYIISHLVAASFSALLGFLRSHLETMTANLKPNEKTLSIQLDLSLFVLDLSRSLNKFYSMQFFLICCRVLINLILSGYFIIDAFRKNYLLIFPDKVWMDFLIFMALLAAIGGDLSSLICICSSCTNFQDAVESFNGRLFSLMRKNSHLCHNDKLSLYIKIKQRVQFTACGFFSIGYPLITSIIATATTHLVILVQFTSPD